MNGFENVLLQNFQKPYTKMFDNKDDEKMGIAALGEFGLIDHLTNDFEIKHPSTVLGIGDDAAIISAAPNKEMVVCTDMLVENVHFDLSYMPLKHLGYKAVVVNLS